MVKRNILQVGTLTFVRYVNNISTYNKNLFNLFVIVEDFNMALSMNRLEPLYGLLPQSKFTESTPPSKKIKLGNTDISLEYFENLHMT